MISRETQVAVCNEEGGRQTYERVFEIRQTKERKEESREKNTNCGLFHYLRNAVIGGRQGREEGERKMGRLEEKKGDLILEESELRSPTK
jgi:hypothetical protein